MSLRPKIWCKNFELQIKYCKMLNKCGIIQETLNILDIYLEGQITTAFQ